MGFLTYTGHTAWVRTVAQDLSQLRDCATGTRHRVAVYTPTMAVSHLRSVYELLRFKIAPAPWVEPKRRGRPRTQPNEAHPIAWMPTQEDSLYDH